MIVRPANLGDVEWITEQMSAFDKFFDAKKTMFNPQTASYQVAKLIDTASQPNPQAIVAVAEDHDGLAGVIAGVLAPHFFNSDIRTLTEIFWWVSPHRRYTTAGARLLVAFEAWGCERADWIIMSVLEQSPLSPMALEDRGYRAKERSLLKEVAA